MTPRVSLILALALARASDSDAGTFRAARGAGHVVSAKPEDGVVLVECGRDLVLLVLASDGVVRDGGGATLTLDDLGAGDVVEWLAERRAGIIMVAEITRLSAAAVA